MGSEEDMGKTPASSQTSLWEVTTCYRLKVSDLIDDAKWMVLSDKRKNRALFKIRVDVWFRSDNLPEDRTKRDGLVLTKVSSLRIKIHIDGAPIISTSHIPLTIIYRSCLSLSLYRLIINNFRPISPPKNHPRRQRLHNSNFFFQISKKFEMF
jgi:hypothetical protein